MSQCGVAANVLAVMLRKKKENVFSFEGFVLCLLP